MSDEELDGVEAELERRENLSGQDLDKFGTLDRLRAKLISRKLMVWLTATVLAVCNKVDGDQWVAVSLAYIGIQGIADIAARWKHGS